MGNDDYENILTDLLKELEQSFEHKKASTAIKKVKVAFIKALDKTIDKQTKGLK